MQTKGAKDRTTNLPVRRRPTLPPELQPPQWTVNYIKKNHHIQRIRQVQASSVDIIQSCLVDHKSQTVAPQCQKDQSHPDFLCS